MQNSWYNMLVPKYVFKDMPKQSRVFSANANRMPGTTSRHALLSNHGDHAHSTGQLNAPGISVGKRRTGKRNCIYPKLLQNVCCVIMSSLFQKLAVLHGDHKHQ